MKKPSYSIVLFCNKKKVKTLYTCKKRTTVYIRQQKNIFRPSLFSLAAKQHKIDDGWNLKHKENHHT